MLKGIDISTWQEGLNLSDIKDKIDFVVCKATEGLAIVDDCCDNFIEQAKANNLLWGFYHFARNNDPVKEADFFYQNCSNYFTHGIPVLDIETNTIKDWGKYATEFTDRIHVLTGVYPIIYTSAAFTTRFNNTMIPNKCGLWVAGYPKKVYGYEDLFFDYDIAPWQFAAMWQFSSTGRFNKFDGYIDLDYAYMDEEAWMKYANPNNVVEGGTAPLPKIDDVHIFEDDEIKVTIILKH